LMGIVYALSFDSIIAFRIVNALLGAWLCVMIFDIAGRSFGEKAARISAVLAVVAPPLIYYCGLHLKEAVIVFLVVLFIDTGDRLLRARKLSVRDILVLGVTAVAMVFFRNALAVVLVVSFAGPGVDFRAVEPGHQTVCHRIGHGVCCGCCFQSGFCFRSRRRDHPLSGLQGNAY
jgi:hypothetical protein